MSQAPLEQQMQMNRLMSRFGNLGIADGAAQTARQFLAEYQAKIDHTPTAQKTGDEELTLDYLVASKRLVLTFHRDGTVSWETHINEELTDSGRDHERMQSLVNWLIHR